MTNIEINKIMKEKTINQNEAMSLATEIQALGRELKKIESIETIDKCQILDEMEWRAKILGTYEGRK